MLPRRKVAIILQLWNNYDRCILEGIASWCRESRNWLVFVEEIAQSRLPELRGRGFDGLIVNFDISDIGAAVAGLEIPVVGLGGGAGDYDAGSGIPYIATDNHRIGSLAAEHLLERGLRHFAFCGYPRSRTNPWVQERAEGFAERLAGHGYDCPVFKGSFLRQEQWEGTQRELVTWLQSLPRPLGVMACFDARARQVLEACRSLGFKVPDEVAVIGVDNDVICDLADPPLSSVEQGCRQIGRQAAATLEEMMEGSLPETLFRRMPPLGVVKRQSSDLIYVDDAAVAEALRMIRQGACSGLQVAGILDKLRISRSTLDKRFRAAIGRSADEEIRRVRLDTAKDLLCRTELRLHDIALRAGYSHEQYLSAVFNKELGTTPAQYRRDQREGSALPPPL
ncbi:MAG: hypothetical protein RL095_3099 [Verrucomicrobiota bacterium]|jgi:LacI family transcriptional regulator